MPDRLSRCWRGWNDPTNQAIIISNISTLLDSLAWGIQPAIYDVWKDHFSLSLSQVGLITTVQKVTLCVAMPFWGWLADRYSRGFVMIGAGVASLVAMCLLGAGVNLLMLIFCSGLEGIATSAFTPIRLAIISDVVNVNKRGFHYGIIGITTTLGNILGAVLGVILAGNLAGVGGWRLAFAVSGFLFGGFSLYVLYYFVEPERGCADYNELQDINMVDLTDKKRVRTYQLFRIPTFWLLIASRALAGIPYGVLSYLIYWLKLIGLSAGSALAIFSLSAFGLLVGFGFSGKLGDWAFRKSPNHGRITAAQVSCVVLIPCIVSIVLGVPRQPEFIALFGVCTFLTGIVLSMSPVLFDGPVPSEVILPEARSRAYAIITTLGAGINSFSTYGCALIAEQMFSFNVKSKLEDLTQEEREHGANALAYSVTLICAVTWVVQFLVLCVAHKFYPRDRLKMQKTLADYCDTHKLAVVPGDALLSEEEREMMAIDKEPNSRCSTPVSVDSQRDTLEVDVSSSQDNTTISTYTSATIPTTSAVNSEDAQL